jgi:hypothetical protein
MYTKGSGFYKYSGKAYENVRKLKEGVHVQDKYRRDRATATNRDLIKNFKSVPVGVPHGLKEIYRGVDLKHAVPYGKDKLLIESKSYMSFSKSKTVASSFPKKINKIHGILVLDPNIIPRRTPVIYNKLWGMKSTVSEEEEVVLLPGTLIISKTPFVNRIHNKPYNYYKVLKYIPYKL